MTGFSPSGCRLAFLPLYSFPSPLPRHQAALLTRQYSRSRPPQREKRLSQEDVFPKGEPSECATKRVVEMERTTYIKTI